MAEEERKANGDEGNEDREETPAQRDAPDRDGDDNDIGDTTPEDRDPNPEDRGVDEDAKCPECGAPIENVRTSYPNCGDMYQDDDYTDEEAGTDFRAGTAIDEQGNEKDVTGDAEVDEDGGDGGDDDDDDDEDTSEGTSEGTSDDEESG